MKIIKPVDEWVRHNPLTNTYDTPDGTHVATEIIDSANCMADIFHIADIREKQRKESHNGT